MATFSIIIPTFNRIDILPEVLAGLEKQESAPEFEVIVIDDGSTDGTGEWLKQRHWTVPHRFESRPNEGPAAARNRGVAIARGERVAFLGDDTVPSAGWLAAHVAALRDHGGDELLAVLGYTGWHRRMRLNPFLQYINDYGLQFGYALIDDPDDVPFNFFYTSNISLPRALVLEEPFNLAFPYPAWEDIELSYRLKAMGLRMVYEARAEVAHDHPTTLERFCSRQEKAGYSGVVFYTLHPELASFVGLGPEGPPPMPRRRRQAFLETLARTLQRLPVRTPKLWEDVLRFYYIQGLHRGWRERVQEQEERE